MTTRRFHVLLLAVLGLAAASFGQDPGQTPPRPRAEARQEGEVHPQRLRALLERRLEQLQTQEERIKALLERLDAGEPVLDLMAEMREQGDLPVLGDGPREASRDGVREPGRGGPPTFEPMSPEAYDLWHGRILAFFDEHAPELATRMREGGQNEEVRRTVHRLRREVERLMALKEQNADEFAPALARLRTGLRIADVLGKVRQHASAGTLTADLLSGFRQELADAVGRQYDAQLDARGKLLDRMGGRLDGARERLERERSERSRRVEAEVKAMLERATQPREPHERTRPPERKRRPN